MVMNHFIDSVVILLWCIAIAECDLLTNIPSQLSHTCKNNPRKRGVIHDCDGKSVGETCTASVAHGFTYTAYGSTTLKCGAKGFFEGPLPQVSPRQCDAPIVQAGVSHTCANKSTGMSCWAYCESGYTGSSSQYECNSVGSITAPVLAAVENPISCIASAKQLSSPGLSRRLSTCDASASSVGLAAPEIETDCLGKAAGQSCIAYCGTGYSGNSATVFECRSDGTFASLSGPLPTCTPIPCNFSAPQGLGVDSDCDGKATGQQCTASCTGAYDYKEGEGPKTFTCGTDQSFTGMNPECIPKPCTVQADFADFKTESCLGKTDGQQCGISCSTGYSGDPAIYVCSGATGQFIPADPTLTINCTASECTSGLPVSSDINSTELVGLTTGQSGHMTCASGYDGQAEVWTCNESGTVKGTNPTCEPMGCDENTLPASPAFKHTCADVKFGGTCTMSCNDGYEFTDGGSIETWECTNQLSTGGVAYVGNEPQCKALQCDTSEFTGKYLDHGCEGIETGGNCSYSCLPGFEPAPGTPTSQPFSCIGSGTGTIFSGTKPICNRMTCDASNIVTMNTCAGINHGETCMVQCARGYDGNTTKECKLDEDNTTVSLQGEELVCIAQMCVNESLGVGLQHIHTCEGLATNETCSVSCAPGYEGEPVNITCTDTGFFQPLSDPIPLCPVITSTSTVSTTSVTSVSATQTTVSVTETTNTQTSVTTVSNTDTSITMTDTTVSTITNTVTNTATTITATITATITSITTQTQTSITTTIPPGQIPTVSGRVKLEVDNPSTFITDADAQAGFNQFMADYMGVPVDDIISVLSLFSGTGKLRRLANANVAADVTVNLPPGVDVSKNAVTQKLEDMGDAQSANLNAALSTAGAPGYNVVVDDVVDIQDGTATTTLPTTPSPTAPPVTDDSDEGMAGGIIALIVILCVVFVIAILAAVAFVFLKRRQDQNNNSNDPGSNLVTNADNTGEIPAEQIDEHGEGAEVRARTMQVNLPQAEDNATDGPEAVRS